MKAAVVTDFAAPLTIEDRPVPAPGPGQVLVRIESSGLCYTDIHAAHGDWPVRPTPPFVPGHEGVGIVHAVGTGVTVRAVGDRVALPWLGHACGHCDHCVSGWETLCEEQVFELHARGRTRVISETRKLDDVNQAIDDVLNGRTNARIVFEL
jgi:propanol-preferring alcohol dehydrogenase